MSSPHYASGKICYLEIPTDDLEQSSEFYENVFGWSTRRRDDGSLAFDDTVNEVSGSWVTGRKPDPNPGLIVYIMTADAATAAEAVQAAGGQIVEHSPAGSSETYFTFRDPSGNCLGVYQMPGLSESEGA